MGHQFELGPFRTPAPRDAEAVETVESEELMMPPPRSVTFIDVPRPARVDSQGRLLVRRHRRTSKGIPVSELECIRLLHRPMRPKLADALANPHVGAYVVMGIVEATTGVTRECLQPLSTDDGRPKDMIASMHAAVRALRPWYVRWFTLKSVGGFGVYECHQINSNSAGGGGGSGIGYHTVLHVSEATRLSLLELYYDFVAQRRDVNECWKQWVHQHFNAGDEHPGERRLGLQLLLQWSVPKIVAYVSTPVVASLIFGFAYTFTVTGPDVDKVAVLQTAWTVASYIVTAAGGKF
ncbi:hypothetical protein PG996_010580 [Apiospora saccharicola]|uniref:Uncharacterized protein n=1 Tax=Apiospora saccharicola TaxID=335842 RepID=A0ABR1URH7_9PEZI